MVHKNAGQVERLLGALAHEEADYYIHLDQAADLRAFAHLAGRPRTYFIAERKQPRWASFHFVEAILQSLREILATGRSYDFINLLSGQDYPIQPINHIHEFLARHVGQSFMSFEGQAGSAWWQEARTRVEQYHSAYYQFKGQYLLQRLANLVLPRRRFPLPYALYGSADGSWWTLSPACAAYLVRFVDEHPAVRRYGQFTWGPDEIIPATILLNSPLKDSIINENYRYIDWTAGGANPKVLTIADAPALAQSPKLFARKFDIDYDAEILNLLDQRLTK
ncbi:MAG: glycosyl transferase [Hymenobacter sp.]|nr:MAG: glycosyl transferase [Hymenobacter sp.]